MVHLICTFTMASGAQIGQLVFLLYGLRSYFEKFPKTLLLICIFFKNLSSDTVNIYFYKNIKIYFKVILLAVNIYFIFFVRHFSVPYFTVPLVVLH
jgi:hypothetical protein